MNLVRHCDEKELKPALDVNSSLRSVVWVMLEQLMDYVRFCVKNYSVKVFELFTSFI